MELQNITNLETTINLEATNLQFNIGVPGLSTLFKRKAPKKKKQQTFINTNILPPLPPWFLQQHKFDLCQIILLVNSGTSIVSVIQHLKSYRFDRNPLSPLNMIYPQPHARMIALANCVILANQNQRMLMAFRALARRWISHRMKNKNEEDLVTGEAPKKKVVLTIWSERSRYIFEATTLLRDMTTRILQHNYLFTKFLIPRNPYTNIHLTYAQFVSVMHQLRSYGITNWIVEALYSMQYDMQKFKINFGDSVKREVITRQFNNTKSEETLDLIYEFIEFQHDIHHRFFNPKIYSWALRESSSEFTRIKQWANYCKEYQLLSATIHKSNDIEIELIRLEKSTKPLCSPPIEIVRKREAYFKKALLEQKEETDTIETIEEEIQPVLEIDTLPLLIDSIFPSHDI